MKKLAVFLLLFVLASQPFPASSVLAEQAAKTLAEALEVLATRGIRVVFTDRLVKPEMLVAPETLVAPSRRPEELLAELLGPHGLRAEKLRSGLYRVVEEDRQADSEESDVVEALPIVEAEIVVRAARPWILGESLSTLSLEREDVLALPHVGRDTFRGLTLLPGVSSDDASARLSVRGGGENELLVLLDGVEILEPYHLKDFNSFLSVLPPQVIERVELLTGGFSAEYGDRLSGVLNLTSLQPSGSRRTEVGLGPLDLRLTSAGGGGARGGRHVVNARGGSLEIPFRFADEEERPIFADLFAKAERGLGDDGSRDGAVGLLLSGDRLRFAEIQDDEEERFRTRYRNGYLWANEQRVRSSDLLTTSRFSLTTIRRDRRGLEREESESFELRDDRRLDSARLQQDWLWQWRPGSVLKWGGEVRRLEASYDYESSVQGEIPRLGDLASENGSLRRFSGEFRGWQTAAYVSQQLQPTPRLSLELGLRFDHNSVLDDNRTLDPRLSADYRLSPRSRLAFSWGEYAQSQRLYELEVEDGVTDFARTERARYWSVGFETELSGRGIAFRRRPPTLRIEAYRRDIGNPRARFDNLLDPISKVPELEIDRFAFRPERTVSEGLEIFFGGAAGRDLDGFISYVYNDAFDRIDGAEVPRLNNQEHTFRLDLVWQTPWQWSVQAAWRSHTGRPTTTVTGQVDENGVLVPVLGELNDERLPDYHRLDLRFSRSWTWSSKAGRSSELELYLLVHNVFSRRNLRGFSVSLEDGALELEPETWGRAIPTFGLRWTF